MLEASGKHPNGPSRQPLTRCTAADPNCTDREGRTPLHWLCKSSEPFPQNLSSAQRCGQSDASALVQVLLGASAAVDSRDQAGFSGSYSSAVVQAEGAAALHYSAKAGVQELVDALLAVDATEVVRGSPPSGTV